jgi:hypothetical protein
VRAVVAAVGPFRCKALRRGVDCVAKKLGVGFLLTRHGVIRE